MTPKETAEAILELPDDRIGVRFVYIGGHEITDDLWPVESFKALARAYLEATERTDFGRMVQDHRSRWCRAVDAIQEKG